MPDRKTHQGIALLILIAYVAILYVFSGLEYWWYGLAVFPGALVPDILDPWSKENRFEHRKFFHCTLLIKPLWIISSIALALSLLSLNFLFITFFGIGYLSHLYADSIKTHSLSKGLPCYKWDTWRFVRKN